MCKPSVEDIPKYLNANESNFRNWNSSSIQSLRYLTRVATPEDKKALEAKLEEYTSWAHSPQGNTSALDLDASLQNLLRDMLKTKSQQS